MQSLPPAPHGGPSEHAQYKALKMHLEPGDPTASAHCGARRVLFPSFSFSLCKMRIIPQGPHGGCQDQCTVRSKHPLCPSSQWSEAVLESRGALTKS